MRVVAGPLAAIDDHGGSLDRAAVLFPDAPRPWIDLSTGINPHTYPFSSLPATAYSRLPEPGMQRALSRIASGFYGAPSADCVTAAPGTQILLPRVATLVAAGRALVLGPTYAEHARTAALAGHRTGTVTDFDALFEADLAVVVNPNNPDGRVSFRGELLRLARHLRGKGGLLVVDEAFMEVGPRRESLVGDVGAGGLVVLRSFGKFFGLAGLRLGFAIAAPPLAGRLAAELGPWSVSGPALEAGMQALADAEWRVGMIERLAADAARLDATLGAAGIAVAGGTSLFRLLRLDAAEALFDQLGRAGILVRRFDAMPDRLRIGLPGTAEEWERLEAALRDWRDKHP